jgi:DNA-binding MarR family transcriptional regulator
MDKEVAVAVLMERMVRDMYPEKSSSAVQPLQWAIMRYLRTAPVSKARVATIADYLGTTHAPVSRAVATLKRRGLVESAAGTNGTQRRAPLQLTSCGLDALNNDPILSLAERVKSLSQPERESFERIISQLSLGPAGRT